MLMVFALVLGMRKWQGTLLIWLFMSLNCEEWSASWNVVT